MPTQTNYQEDIQEYTELVRRLVKEKPTKTLLLHIERKTRELQGKYVINTNRTISMDERTKLIELINSVSGLYELETAKAIVERLSPREKEIKKGLLKILGEENPETEVF